jgi:alkanesulfonate monooxygenase SsuD/methylene tetrahydromethanopterin reductase-like flavin-dependent oxidoreductase (luciferase family)
MGAGGDARSLAELAYEAEAAGWDGVFVWDAVCVETEDPRNQATYDPWIALAAIAMRTQRVRLGTIITPLSRRRPWKVARETATLDHLSGGRLILPVGLGAIDDGGFSKVGEETDRKIRAQMLDEGLEMLAGLWSGQPFSFHGQHYQVQEMTFSPPPVQSPRIPIWVVGAWPRPRSMRRALQWDGILPSKMNEDGSFADISPADIRDMRAYIAEHRSQTTPFDIVLESETPGDDRALAVATVLPYAEAGVTWWLEAVWQWFYKTPGEIEAMRTRIKQGPPRVA